MQSWSDKKQIVLIALILFFLIFPADGCASGTNSQQDSAPWFTGPLIASAAKTVAEGHQNYEPYIFATDNIGYYNRSWHRISETNSQIYNPMLLYTVGLNHFMDLQVTIPYDLNTKENYFSHGISDISVYLGFQILNDNPHSWEPDCRFTIQEAFPTGRYQNLNPQQMKNDVTGSGSYQTGIAFNFQKLLHIYKVHYLRTRLSLTYTFPAPTTVHNFNAYGGGFGTQGTVNPGDNFSADLAFELTMTRNWVAVMEMYYIIAAKSTFKGQPGFTQRGKLASVGNPSDQQLSLAPAIEYNFNADVGIIAGAWFSVTGRDATDFVSGVVAVNIYI